MIRELQGINIPRMAELETELFGRGAWNESMIRQEIAAPARTYIVDVEDHAGEDGDIRGYAGFWYDGDDAELMTIGVDGKYHRQGIATGLMSRMIQLAKTQGARRMLLEVRVDNEPALALYRRFGFQMMGRRKRYYQPEGVDAFTMSLDLQPRIAGFQAETADMDYDDACGVSAEHTGKRNGAIS